MSSEVDCTFRGNIIVGEIPLGLGEFEPFFKQATKSRYAEKYSFNTHLTQDDFLGWRLAMDCPDLYNEVKTKLAHNPWTHCHLRTKPLPLWIYFWWNQLR